MARQWMRLDTNYWYDDKVAAAGPGGAVLYLQAIGLAHRVDSPDGVLTWGQLEMLPIAQWSETFGELGALVDVLIDVGLFERSEASRGRARRDVRVVAWSDWSVSQGGDKALSSAAQRSRKYRAKKSRMADSDPLPLETSESEASRDVARDIARDDLERKIERKIEREREARDVAQSARDVERADPAPPEKPQDQEPITDRLFECFGWRIDIAECEQLAEWARAKNIPDDVLVDVARLNPYPSDVRSELRTYEPRVVPAFTWDRDADAAIGAAHEAELADENTRGRVADVIELMRHRLTDSPEDIEKKQQLAREELARMDEEPW